MKHSLISVSANCWSVGGKLPASTTIEKEFGRRQISSAKRAKFKHRPSVPLLMVTVLNRGPAWLVVGAMIALGLVGSVIRPSTKIDNHRKFSPDWRCSSPASCGRTRRIFQDHACVFTRKSFPAPASSSSPEPEGRAANVQLGGDGVYCVRDRLDRARRMQFLDV